MKSSSNETRDAQTNLKVAMNILMSLAGMIFCSAMGALILEQTSRKCLLSWLVSLMFGWAA